MNIKVNASGEICKVIAQSKDGYYYKVIDSNNVVCVYASNNVTEVIEAGEQP